ncbi:MAG: right-handed parallel beta-helix repeat-containing protein [Verrucomicrobiota bacterium]
MILRRFAPLALVLALASSASAGGFFIFPWTDDASSGITGQTIWAYNLGSATGTTIASQTVTGNASAAPSTADFDITGTTGFFFNDTNNVTGTGSTVIANDFIFNGNPAVVTLKGLTPGTTYVASFLSVGFDAVPTVRVSNFTSGGDSQLVPQNEYGNDNGIRVDYVFTADAATRDVTIPPGAPGETWHHYGLTLKTTRVVTNTNESGAGSLRQTIADADPGDTITFDSALSGGTIDLTGAQLTIDKNLTIDASALADGITIDAGGNGDFIQDPGESRCLFISDGDDSNQIAVALNHLTLQNGSHEGNNAGANLYNDRENVTLTDCHILGGRAFGGSSADANGGGIFSQEGDLTMTGCSISGNQTQGGDADGGGIFSQEGDLTMTSCSVSGNHTQGSGADGGGIFFSSGNLTMTGCSVSGNQTQGFDAQGGGILSRTNLTDQTTRLTNCTISGNAALNASGGGLYNNIGRTVLTHCTLTANAASSNQGAGLASFADNETETEVLACIVAGNSVVDVDLVFGATNSFQSGGHNMIGTGSALAAFNQTGDQTNITDPGLSPLGWYGGPVQTHHPLASSPAIDAAGTTDPGDTDNRGFGRFVNGTLDIGAVEAGPVILVDNTGDSAATSTTLRKAIADATTPGTVIRFDTATFDGEPADVINNGAEIDINGDKSIFIDASDVNSGVTIDSGGNNRIFHVSDLASNLAMHSLDLANGQIGGFGGALRNAGTLTVAYSTVRDSHATSNGGVLDNTFGARAVFTHSLLHNNSGFNGGAIGSVGILEVVNSTFSGNTASNNGGAIASFDTLSTRGSTFVGNLAVEGGAVRSVGSAFEAVNSTFWSNTANFGGAISIADGGPPAILTHLTITGNTASNAASPVGGGGMFFFNKEATLTGCLVADNNNFFSPDVQNAGSSVLTSGGGNLIGDNTGLSWTADPGDIIGTSGSPVAPLLAPLGSYGGPTQTLPPLPGSPLIEAGGDVAAPPPTDQLGTLRPIGLIPDIGAVEAIPLAALGLPSTDGDNIPDILEGPDGLYPHLSPTADDSNLDTDGDGSSDEEEIDNMTNLFDPDDKLRITEFQRIPQSAPLAFDFSFSTFPGLSYDILTDDDLDFSDATLFLEIDAAGFLQSDQFFTFPVGDRFIIVRRK